MAEGHYLLKHQVFEPGGQDANWTKSFATAEEARLEANQYWVAGDQNIRQVISDTVTGEEIVRRSDGSWAWLRGPSS